MNHMNPINTKVPHSSNYLRLVSQDTAMISDRVKATPINLPLNNLGSSMIGECLAIREMVLAVFLSGDQGEAVGRILLKH